MTRCVPALNKLKVEGGQQIGVNIVKRAITEPQRMIAENVWRRRDCAGQGFRVETTFGLQRVARCASGLAKAAMLDPAMIARAALTNASSITSPMRAIDALVSEIPVAASKFERPRERSRALRTPHLSR